MSYSLPLEFSDFESVNYLWPQFVESIGIDKAQRAIYQALDLQRMHGCRATLPVLISETCGIALASIELIRLQTGIPCNSEKMILLLSTKNHLIQLLYDT